MKFHDFFFLHKKAFRSPNELKWGALLGELRRIDGGGCRAHRLLSLIISVSEWTVKPKHVQWCFDEKKINFNHVKSVVTKWIQNFKMKSSAVLISVLLFGSIQLISLVRACPDSCKCANNGAMVDCSRKSLTRIPSNLPRNTITL